MVDLARQAFCTGNFDLAAEIYERTIREDCAKSQNVALHLGLADSYARSGDLRRAFQAYSAASRLGNITIDQLNHLVTSLVEMMSRNQEFIDQTLPKARDRMEDPFTCAICTVVWDDPVTVGCGHTFCRKCLENEETRTCKQCGLVLRFRRPLKLKTNVLLSSTAEKWYPGEVAAIKLKSRGNALFTGKKFREAINFYDQAFVNAPTDHLIASNRSYAYACLSQYGKALEDANRVVTMRPDWPKGYYRKGVAYSGLHRHEEAAFAYLQCLTLDPSVTSARTALAKELQKVFSPLGPGELTNAEYQLLMDPSSFGGQPGLDSLTPLLTVGMLQRVKSSLRNRLTQASPSAARHTHTLMTSQAKNSSPEFDFSKASIQERSRSLPTSPKSSHKHLSTRNRSRSENDTSNLDCYMYQRLSRKRHGCEMVHPPQSPSKVVPNKLAREESSACVCSNKDKRYVPSELLNREDFDCSLCYRLLFHPVTTPCGHVFCRQCLYRCLDHNDSCPLCKTSLVEYLAERRQAVTEAVEKIIQKYFPAEFAERLKQHEEEILDLARVMEGGQQEIPVFVCTLAYPTVSCPLHVFEPRYRLMVRQCMESGTRQFGMCTCLSDREEQFADYGCMLEIRDVQYFPDGRAVVDTVGGRRFRVLERGNRNGYNMAKVEFLHDQPVREEEVDEIQQLQVKVHKESEDWFASLPVMHQLRIQNHFGEFPGVEHDLTTLENGPAWAWWITAVLPLDPRAQLTILSMTSLRERLLGIERVLKYVRRRESQ